MDERLNFNPTMAVVRRHWRLFLLVGAAAAVLSAIFSGPAFIKPRYRSQAVVYPVHISTYSVETTTDQLLQLLASNSIRDSVVGKFDLVEHYGLDTSKAEDRSLLQYMWQERVGIEKTRFESVALQVTDEDPVMARDMALEILRQADLLNRRLQRENSRELLRVVQADLANTRAKMDSIEARLNQLRQTKGLLDYETQTEEITKGYMRALAGGSGNGSKAEIASMLDALENHGGEFLRLTVLNRQLVDDYAKKLAQERQLDLDLTKELTYSNVVVSPEVPDKKVYPIRWLIVLVSIVAALFLCYVLVALREQQRGSSAREHG